MRRQLDKLRLRLRSLFRGRVVDHELARELRAHLDEEIAAHRAAGMSPEAARQAALRAFGSVAAAEEACRDTRRVHLVENAIRDCRYAIRTLVRQPGLLAAAATSIGIGAGANLTIFALASQLLLSVPSAERPHELVHIRTGNGSHVSYRAWQQLRDSGALAGLAGYQFEQSVNWRAGDQSVSLVPLLVTANFFDVVGVPLALGRGFTAAEAQAAREPRLVVVSYGFWQRRLGGDAAAIGRALILNGEPYIVTGVLQKNVKAISGYGLAPEVYLPLSPALVPSLFEPRTTAAQLVGRLHDGQSADAARAAIAAAAARIAEVERDQELATITTFARVGGLSQVKDLAGVGAFFAVLFVVSSLVLAIACANVAGLLVARGLARRREIALRLALGASRRRLLQQLLVEALVLAGAGTIVGGALTAIVFLAISRLSLPLPIPIELQFAIDWRLTIMAAGLVLVSTCVSGLVPALQATRALLLPALKLDEVRIGARRVPVRALLVSAQVAVSLLLLVTALTFVRNLTRAASVDPGFDVEGVLVAQVSFVEGRQGPAARPAVEDIVDRVRALPGVTAAAFSEGVPLTIFSGRRTGTEVRIDGRETRVDYSGLHVGPGYFATMGIGLLRGRDFTAADRQGAAPVVIVNEEFAQRYLAGTNPIGRRIADLDTPDRVQEVIGVVSNGKYRSLAEAQEPAVYDPFLQWDRPQRLVHLLVRAPGESDSLAAAVRQAVLAADGSAAVTLAPLREALAFALLPSQFASAVLGALGALGTLLAMVGLFGIVSFTVSRRTAEIAVRTTLGASRLDVVLLVARGAARLVAGGVLVAVGLAWLIMAPLTAFLVVGVSPSDPTTMSAAIGLLLVAAAAAIWPPVHRALRVDASAALRLDG